MPFRFALALLLAAFVGEGCAAPPPPAANPAPPRWIAFHAPPLKGSLEPLARHRRNQGYEVTLIETSAGGMLAAWAKTDALKQAPRPGDVVLVAGAMDGRGGARKDCVLPGGTGTRGRMKGLPSDGVLTLDDTGAPGWIAGRLPAGSPQDLETMVRKILAYEATDGPSPADHRLSCIVGNPMPGAESSLFADLFVSLHSAALLGKMHDDWRITGAADCRAHSLAKSGTAFPGGVRDSLASPYEVLAYFGHSNARAAFSLGNPYLLPEEWSRPQGSGIRGLFFTCGCNASEHQESYTVQAVRAPAGPVAAIGASRISYSAIGYLAGRGLAGCMHDSEGPATVGEWWGRIRQAIAREPISGVNYFLFDRIDGSGGRTKLADQRLEHLEMWSLLGDPATRMPRGK